MRLLIVGLSLAFGLSSAAHGVRSRYACPLETTAGGTAKVFISRDESTQRELTIFYSVAEAERKFWVQIIRGSDCKATANHCCDAEANEVFLDVDAQCPKIQVDECLKLKNAGSLKQSITEEFKTIRVAEEEERNVAGHERPEEIEKPATKKEREAPWWQWTRRANQEIGFVLALALLSLLGALYWRLRRMELLLNDGGIAIRGGVDVLVKNPETSSRASEPDRMLPLLEGLGQDLKKLVAALSHNAMPAGQPSPDDKPLEENEVQHQDIAVNPAKWPIESTSPAVQTGYSHRVYVARVGSTEGWDGGGLRFCETDSAHAICYVETHNGQDGRLFPNRDLSDHQREWSQWFQLHGARWKEDEVTPRSVRLEGREWVVT